MPLSNNAARVIVAVITIPFIILASYFGNYWFFTLVMAIAVISYYEFYKMAEKKEAFANLWLGLIGVAILVLNQYLHFFDIYFFFLLYIVLLVLFELFRNKGSAIFNLGATLFGVIYIGFCTSAILGIREFYPDINGLYDRGGFLIISILASIWICDSAAFYGGTSLGKHKLFPRVSPNKSWEGAIFGFLFAIISMILAKEIVLDFLSWQTTIAIGVIIGTIGQLGDLVESLLKRDAGVKDSSAIIPGHGGIFDRFDSLLLIAPVVFLYLKFIGR